MSNFPNEIMPANTKKNSPVVTELSDSKMYAEAFNTHDEEIRSIQSYLIEQGGLTDKTNALVSKINSLTNGMTGLQVLSGNVVSGMRIMFPESAIATYLTKYPTATDTTVYVNSTVGFPENGTISIINKIDSSTTQGTNVELIRYSGKTDTEFRLCQRGYNNTFAGDHSLSSSAPTGLGVTNNSAGTPTRLAANRNIMFDNKYSVIANWPRNYQARRDKTIYLMPSLGWAGTQADLIYRLTCIVGTMTFHSNAATAELLQAAGAAGVLRTNDDGTFKFVSSDVVLAALEQLTYTEAKSLYDTLLGLGGVLTIRTAAQFDWPDSHVPVFQGLLNLSLSPTTVIQGVNAISLCGIRLYPNGDVFVAASNIEGIPTWASVCYKITYIPQYTSTEQAELFLIRG